MLSTNFVADLISPGPAQEYREALMLYGQFVGDWTTETREWKPDGSMISSQWDIRFQWVLEGRAIQDLWITPPRREGPVALTTPGNRYSTTLRIYDPKINAWHIIWINPPSGTIVRQLGRRVGDEIIQIGSVDAHGSLARWVYRDITRSAFRWCNEKSIDNGATWTLVQEMRATRESPDSEASDSYAAS